MKVRSTLLAFVFGLCSLSVLAEKTTATAEPVAVSQSAEPKQAVSSHIHAVNINTASAAELQDKLVGIGAKKAQAIVEYRDKQGKFVSIEQLTEVSGIGKATLDKNRDRIFVQ